MDCSCGSNTFTKLQEKQDSYTIKYCECKSCGRIGGEKLYQQKQIIETGILARDRYVNASYNTKPKQPEFTSQVQESR
jgi:hypothetical protein